jgi:hypothetical protein
MNRYWFKPRSHGYGAAPVTWEGWGLTLVLALALIVSIVMELEAGRSNFAAWMVWAVIVAVAILWFARISRRRTDGDWRWRWGDNTKGSL